MGSNQSLIVAVGIGAAAIVAGSVISRLLSDKKKNKVALVDPQVKYQFPLVFKEELTHDTRKMRFGLPSAEHTLGLPLGQHVYLSAKVNGELTVRPYTPTSSEQDKGYFDLVLKVYKSGVHPKFPNGGKLTQHLDSMEVGDTIDVRGPSGRLQYKQKGVFEISVDKRTPPTVKQAKRVGMIAGGTGITPMFQLIKDVCNNPDDHTKLQLIFANQSENDILLREEIDEFAANSNGQFEAWYTIDKSVEPNWKFSVGFVDEQMIAEHLPPAGDDSLILMCGPPPMINFACVPNLEKLGFTKEMRFAY